MHFMLKKIVQLTFFDTIVISMFSIILSCMMVNTVCSLIFHFASLRLGPGIIVVTLTGMDVKYFSFYLMSCHMMLFLLPFVVSTL